MNVLPEDILKLCLAILVGGLIGFEREFRDKAAGFRTLILICTGAALFTIFSLKMGGDNNGTRIAAQIVSGVGFLGAGVILREGGRVIGLTTAAMIWLTAALGMGIGGGEYPFSLVSACIISLVLWVFPRVEQWINVRREERTYEVVFHLNPEKFTQIEALVSHNGLHAHGYRQVKSGEDMICTWVASGPLYNHERLRKALLEDPEIREFRY